jgi:hypothetical protein
VTTARRSRGPVGGAVAAALALALLTLAGCQRGSGTAPKAGAAPPAPQRAAPVEAAVDPAVTDATRRMAAGVPVGESTAPVEVRFDLVSVPAPGQPFQLDVAVLAQAPAPVLRIDVAGGAGLTIADPSGTVVLEKIQAGTVQHVPVTAASSGPGTRIFNVKVTLELPSGAESRGFAFPVIVGGSAAPAAAPAAAPPASAKSPG